MYSPDEFNITLSPSLLPLLRSYFGCECVVSSALSSLVLEWAEPLYRAHRGPALNESDMKRGCGALYCEDQLLVLREEKLS